ncbi:MAG: DNA-processing protein DprA, partial [Deltaproteobacteria bacterium]|nr:DNA-processing protein DprA [Deltaproteobacteria bacterium]
FEETNEYTFARRNQYIAEISKAVIVIEGGEKSGAGLTAEYAFRKSIEVFALPGPVTSDKSFCPNLLISKGAKIIYSEKVISDFLGLTDFGKNQRDDNSVYNEISDDETSILKIISDIREAHIDEILVKSGRGAGEVNELLLSMELKGIIEQLPGKIYRKRSY